MKMQKTEKKKTSTNPPPRWDGAAQLMAGNSEKTDAGGPSPQMTAPLEGGEHLLQDVQAGAPYMGSQERTTQDEPSVGNLLPSVRMVSLLISTEQDREKIHTGPFANW